ncbi:hypothetical protein GCM10027449_19090 [Sinomonas notoginsengisoli]|uniref:lysoplasmalogenase n=1 Tax=Sinomonas notoginsengisoli TaxID=1457311 RepID=UPI001F33DAA5|nr:lysoplasmalogenase [Sinomonas notoginsengisoli]
MTPLVGALATLAALAALIDWRATARGADRVQHRTKPAPMVLLIAAAAAVQPWHGWTQVLLLAAFAASLAGDVLLLPGRPLAPGLAAFLVAHVFFVAAFVTGASSVAGTLFAAALLAVVLPLAAPPLLRAVHDTDPRLSVPVAIYVAALAALVLAAGTTGSLWALVGAALFLASDLLLGWRAFVRPVLKDWHVMAAYHGAQFAILGWAAAIQ